MLYASCRSLCKFLQDEDNEPIWTKYWQRRDQTTIGPLAAMRWPMSLLDIQWTGPFSVSHGDHALDLSERPDDQLWHNLREMLRCAAWKLEATRRPKDFKGTENGIQRKHLIMSSECGPSLHSAGQWTGARLAATTDSDGICPRCEQSVEYLEHRLWECPCNSKERVQFFSQNCRLKHG